MLTRAASAATTGGLANPVVATVELGAAIVTSLLALLAPVLAFLMVLSLLLLLAAWRILRKTRPA